MVETLLHIKEDVFNSYKFLSVMTIVTTTCHYDNVV